MRMLYMKPELDDLSQESRIAFARQFRFMTQDNVSDKLGLTGECKRRTMTRYEKGDRNPKDGRTLEIVKKYSDNYKSQLLWFDLNPSNILIDRINGKYKLSAIIDPGGAKYGIKEWDIAFLRCETCINEKEYKSIVDSYKKLDKTLNEEVIEALCVFIELDDMIIRVVDQIDLPIPYCTVFKDIISKFK